ncbi:MAG: hypothetical protein QM564_06800 [Bergeyella sp.]
MKSLKDEIAETRAILGKTYDTVPDESIAQLLHTFRLLVRAIIKNVEKESL